METIKSVSQWPKYPIGPHEGIFALGVVAVKFAAMEALLEYFFWSIFDLKMDNASIIFANVGPMNGIKMMRDRLKTDMITDLEKEHTSHFFEAYDICNLNRNNLLHSSAGHITPHHTVLFKTAKSGKILMLVPTLSELKKFADSMHEFCEYGRGVVNALGRNGQTTFSASNFPWPDKPNLPLKMSYSSDPHPLP